MEKKVDLSKRSGQIAPLFPVKELPQFTDKEKARYENHRLLIAAGIDPNKFGVLPVRKKN